MKNRKGMVYTTFAIIATSLLILLFAFTSTSQDYTADENPFRIGEASYYLKNIEGDLGRAHQIAARRAASSVVNYTVRNGEPVENLDETLENVTLNGSTEDFETVVENSSLNSWKETVIDSAQESRYQISIEFNEITFENSQTQLQTTVNASTRLEDPTTSTQFNNTPQRTNSIDFEGYEDTMLLIRSEDTYINNYRKCSFDTPAEHIATGTDSNDGSTYGEATTDTSAENREQKILVNNEPSNGEAFAGVITDDSVSYNDTKYISGLDADSIDITEGQNLILYQDQAWNSRIREVIETGCYMQSTTETVGPGIKERLQNQLEAEEDKTQGLETIIDKSRLPQGLQYLDRSNLGYQYFRGTSGEEIAGLTGDQAFNPDRDGYRNGFRLDTEHIQEWNLDTPDGGLTY